MKLRMTMLTSACVTVVALSSCSDDSAKKIRPAMEAGAGGEAGESSQAGGTGGTGGSVSPGGGGNSTGGVDTSPGASGGVAGEPVVPGEAGALGEAGAPAIPASPLFLFTVEAGAIGLPSTDLATSSSPAATVFSSSTLNPDPVKGKNVARISAAQLGLADSDAIDAIAALEPTPKHAVYWFSVSTNGQGTEGERPTRLARSSRDAEAIGDVYFSDATLSFRNLGEGGDRLGYNGLVTDEQSIGLSPAAPTESHLDNLTGVQILPTGQLPSTLYFSVDVDSGGLRGSAVAATAAADRACTIFESALDGKNAVAFTCADLGLGTTSDVKGLVVYGATRPSEVLFAVDRSSTGLPGTAVDGAVSLPSDVFASPLDGSNTLRVAGVALGLSATDHLDALTVVDQPVASYAYDTTCSLSPAPNAVTGAAVTSIQGAHQLGNDLILVSGPGLAVEAAIDSVGAYNLKTCAFVAKAPIAATALSGRTWAPVPLAGWSATAPLALLEYWSLAVDGSAVNRLDTGGAVLASYPLDGVAADTSIGFSLDYDAVHDRFYAVLDPQDGFGEYQRVSFARPPATAVAGTPLESLTIPIPHPCAFAPGLSGVDAQGNSVYGQLDSTSQSQTPDFRVCTLSARSGEFTTLPFTWSLQTQSPSFAVLIPEDSLYALIDGDSVTIQRYPRQP